MFILYERVLLEDCRIIDCEYDFGDGWCRIIQCKRIIADCSERYPHCVAAIEDAPVEDYGGPEGFGSQRDICWGSKCTVASVGCGADQS